MTSPFSGTCYIDGFPCDCGAFDVMHDGCPRDEYGHEEDADYSDADLEDQIEQEYRRMIDEEYQDIFK